MNPRPNRPVHRDSGVRVLTLALLLLPAGSVLAAGDRWPIPVATLGNAIGLGGLLLVSTWLVLGWRRVGRDPVAGTIESRSEVPGGHPPDMLRYLLKYDYDTGATAAALVHMAANRHLTIDRPGEHFIVRRGSGRPSARTEQVLFDVLFEAGDTASFDPSEHEHITKAIGAHRDALISRVEGNYFNQGLEWWSPAAAVSLLSALGMTLLNRGALSVQESCFIFALVLILNLAVGSFLVRVSQFWRKNPDRHFGNFIGAVLLSGLVWGWLLIPTFAFAREIGVLSTLILLGHLAIVAVFFDLIKAPTERGRRLLDAIHGMQQQMKVEGPGRNLESMDEFERLLPYAIALDCTDHWASRFEEAIRRAERNGSIKERKWYSPRLLSRGALTGPGIRRALYSELSRGIARAAVSPISFMERITGIRWQK